MRIRRKAGALTRDVSQPSESMNEINAKCHTMRMEESSTHTSTVATPSVSWCYLHESNKEPQSFGVCTLVI